MKLNKSKQIDILLETPGKLNGENDKMYTIINNSKESYIIDPFGFIGNSYWIVDGKKIEPADFFRGHYKRDDNELCKDDLIILNPSQKISTYINLDYYNKGIYDFSKQGNYILNVKSKHNRQNATLLGCDSYIKILESQGYRVLEDSIVAKIPFVK
ncbi:hypothetical protein IX38_16200 [Chryseobacterium luteum]|uniref:Uncharacterized protein n=2 Tax=Chryseobacterium luteum TaxID=421531 RepID=A0A085ZC68_9FLAO|nr:hypothetical protein IX38_16200 [Chryseobacterium luteum]